MVQHEMCLKKLVVNKDFNKTSFSINLTQMTNKNHYWHALIMLNLELLHAKFAYVMSVGLSFSKKERFITKKQQL